MARTADVFRRALLLLVGVAVPLRSNASGVESQVLPEYSRTRVKVTNISSKSRLPTVSHELHCNITIEGKEIALQLVENDLLKIDTPIYYANDDREIVNFKETDQKYKNTRFFQDTGGMAAVALTPRITQGTSLETHDMEGLIFYANSTYRMTRIREYSTGAANNSEPTHYLKKINRRGWITDYIQIGHRNSKVTETNKSSANTRQRRGAPAYEIDLLYVLDYSTYQRFLTEMRIKNASVTAAAVFQEMRYYYAQVSNGVDMRYRGINSTAWTIRTKLIAFYIVTRAVDSNWTESIRTSGGLNGWNAISASAGLANFATWVSGASGASVISSLPTFDHAALFTMYDIFGEGANNDPGSRNYGVVGLSYLGALCTSESVSIVENTGALTEAETSAHEIGHSLGARHDGDNNTCSAASQYIMTAVSTVATQTTVSNYYVFSTCSIDYFTSYIASLNPNCMTNTGNYFNATEWQAHMKLLPGQAYTPNDLCRQAFGASYEACGGIDYGSKVCLSLKCYNTTAPSLKCQSIVGGGRGPDGLSCGNKRWCRSGICVSNSSAPNASDICPIGDLSRTMPVYTNEPYVCSNMPASYCYDQRVFNTCCSTCSKLMDATRPGCLYGDKIDCSAVSSADCPLNLDNCCKTCSVSTTTRRFTTNMVTVSSTTQKNRLKSSQPSIFLRSSMAKTMLHLSSACVVVEWLFKVMHSGL